MRSENRPITEFKDHYRFFKNIQENSNTKCLEWKGCTTDNGYGAFNYKRKVYRSHRIAFFIYYGKISEILVIDHKCRNRLCCNPLHLREVTSEVNSTENSLSLPAENKLKTHCKSGHEFTETNTYQYKHNKRMCRICRIKWKHNYESRKRSNL